MIIDKIENASLYTNISDRLAKALETLNKVNFAEKEKGRHDIDGDNVFYLVQPYTTLPLSDGKLETHIEYIDVHYMAKGEELIGYTPFENLEVDTPYDPAGDGALYKVPDKIGTVILSHGMFCVCFPKDAHMPCRQIDAPQDVLKIVVKVKVND